MKRKEYSDKDFLISRAISISFTVIFVVISIVFGLSSYVNTEKIPEELGVTVGLWYLGLPVLIIISWYMSIERYLIIEFRKLGKEATKLEKLWYFVSIIMMILLGMKTYRNILNLVVFVESYRKLLEWLSDCLLLRLGFVLGWMVIWIGSILLRKIIVSKENGHKKILTVGSVLVVVVIMLYIQTNSERYIYDRTEDVWYHKMVEYYEQHEGESNVEPFSCN